jgi:hypothetical protein
MVSRAIAKASLIRIQLRVFCFLYEACVLKIDSNVDATDRPYKKHSSIVQWQVFPSYTGKIKVRFFLELVNSNDARLDKGPARGAVDESLSEFDSYSLQGVCPIG